MGLQYLTLPFGMVELTAQDGALTGCRRVWEWGRDCPDPVTEQAAAELEEYCAGCRREFTVPLRPAGTAFQQAVWAGLREIPYGENLSYGELARQLGKPGAARAVGTAAGANPLLIFTPCHRLLAAGGGLGGFSAGLDAKVWLLELEHIPWRDGVCGISRGKARQNWDFSQKNIGEK